MPIRSALLNRAMYGTKDAAQRTMEKPEYNIGEFNPCLYKHLVEDISVLRHGDDFATLATRAQIADFKEQFEQTFAREAHSDIGSATTTP